jgi:Caspase domain
LIEESGAGYAWRPPRFLEEAAAHIGDRWLGEDLRDRASAPARNFEMIKRLVPMAAMVGAAIFAMVAAPAPAWADKRVALVVGNSSYQTVPQLPNPSRDANSVAKMFRDAGFDSVELVLNVGNLDFKRAIRKFENTADQADIAVVYYAGHGLEIGGTNYLIPVDARLASDRDADDEAIPLERLVSSADGAKRLRLIMLDACRDNPFVTSMRRERKVANRAVSSGLGRVEPTSTDTLIAYAAKAGSTADDGDGEHSPFTTAVLKNLTVPGLDVRLAFGRVRDEVLKVTGNRQEPFVYGSLGGGNVSLVPAPVVPQPAAESDVRADYELVQRIGSKRAWEVFLNQHPTGFYADLAKAQIEQLNKQPVATPVSTAPAPPSSNSSSPNPSTPKVTVAALPPDKTPQSRDSNSKEAIEWDKVKDATDPAVLQKFIKRFPDSPLAINAQQRIDVLKKAQQEREAQAAAAAAEAQRKAAEIAAQKKREDDERRAREAEAAEKARAAAAEAAAQKKREDDERRAREAEAAEKAKAAAAEAAAQRKREEDERRAAAAEAERQAKAAEAARKAQEAQQKAEQAEREKAAAAAVAAAAAAEKQAREAEAARKKAEAAAAKEAACKDEQGKLEAILAKGSEGTGVDDLKNFSRTVTCDRLGPVVVASLDRFNAEAAKRAATQPNSPQLIRSAQTELVRLGCLATTVAIDGTLAAPTVSALSRYLSIEGQPTERPTVTQDLVTELTKHTTRVCPIECKTGESLKGAVCVADQPAAPAPAPSPAPATASKGGQPAAATAKKDDDTARKKQQASRPSDQDQPKRQKQAAPAPEAPHARQQALARPSIVSGGGIGGGGGGGSHTMIGVGF